MKLRTKSVYHSSVKTLSLCLITFFLTDLSAQYITNGSAVQLSPTCVRLTDGTVMQQKGSAFFNEPLDLSQPFSFSGSMFFGANDAGADGMTFLLAPAPAPPGGSGGTIGYSGIEPSLAVEFDTFQNETIGDPAADHLCILANGAVVHNSAAAIAAPVTLPNIEDGREHCFTIAWNPAVPVFEVTLSGTTAAYNGDISAFFPPGAPVYYGFTGSTGGAVNEQRVCLYDTEAVENLEIIGPTVICQSDGVQTLQTNAPGGTWSVPANADGSFDPAALSPGNYTVTYTVGNAGCDYTAHFSFEILDAAEIILLTQDNINCHHTAGKLEVRLQNGPEPLEFSWNTGAETLLLENLTPGIYSLSVTGTTDCVTVADYEIRETAEPQIEPLDIIPAQCDANNVLQPASFAVEISGGFPPFAYSISDSGAEQQDNFFFSLTRENGTVILVDADNCTATLDYSTPLAEFPTPKIATTDTQLCEENITLTVDAEDTETILWSTGETADQISTTLPNTYAVTLTNEFACSARTEIKITDCLRYDIPNVFTPNGDGINDTFGPVIQARNFTFTLKIFNRWGELIFNGNENWDGTADGKPSPADVSTYLIEIRIGDIVFFEKGEVNLLR